MTADRTTRAARGSAILLIAAALAAGCGSEAPPEGGAAPDSVGSAASLQERADRIAQSILILDTHIDVPSRLVEEMEDISVRTAKGDFDHPRAKQGGLDAAFMSIYVPAEFQEDRKGGARPYADRLIDMVEGFETQWPDKFAVVRSVAEVESARSRGVIALPLGMENGAPIETSLENLKHFHDRGIRYITLTHSENNAICDSSYADERRWNGLSPFGREVVAEMNRLGIMIDVSHISDAAFHQVMEISRAPVIASHSSCRRFTEGWERNMDDDMIRLLAAKGGVIQINFGSAFIHPEAHRQSMAYWNERRELMASQGLGDDAPELDEHRSRYWETHDRIYADISDVADHIDHVVALVGVDHVGFGSDFDGVGDSLPTGLKDVSGYPNLIRVLLERGYSEEDIRKIAAGNTLRVWSEVERIAAEMSAAR